MYQFVILPFVVLYISVCLFLFLRLLLVNFAFIVFCFGNGCSFFFRLLFVVLVHSLRILCSLLDSLIRRPRGCIYCNNIQITCKINAKKAQNVHLISAQSVLSACKISDFLRHPSRQSPAFYSFIPLSLCFHPLFSLLSSLFLIPFLSHSYPILIPFIPLSSPFLTSIIPFLYLYHTLFIPLSYFFNTSSISFFPRTRPLSSSG